MAGLQGLDWLQVLRTGLTGGVLFAKPAGAGATGVYNEELNMMKLSRKLRILLSTIFIVALFVACSFCAAAQSPSREIAIVYDDSGSMVKEDDIYQANWCRAKYALEVFSAMLQEGDEMTVYPMSNYRDSVAGRAAPLHLSLIHI